MDKKSASPPSAPPPRPGRSRRQRRFFFIIGALVLLTALYAACGYLLLPRLVRDMGARKLTAALGRKTAIEQVIIDPFRLTAEARGLAIQRRDDTGPLLAINRLRADFQAASLFKRTLIVRRLDIQGPLVSLTRNADATFNLSDLLPAGNHNEEQKPDGYPFRFSVNNITLSDGTIIFDDRPTGTYHRVTSLHLTLPAISNLAYAIDTFVQPSLTCFINDTPVNLGGKTKPFKDTLETRFDLVLNDLDLPFYLDYLPGKRNFTLAGGSLSTNLALTYIQPPGEPTRLEISGTAGIHNLVVVDAADDSFHFLDLPALTAVLAPGNLLAGECNLTAVNLTQPRLTLHRRADGTIRLPELALATTNQAATAAVTPPATEELSPAEAPAGDSSGTGASITSNAPATGIKTTPTAGAGTSNDRAGSGTETAATKGTKADEPVPPANDDKPFFHLAIKKLRLAAGTIEFSDDSPEMKPFTAIFAPVTVEITDFLTTGEHPAALAAEARTDAGEHLTVNAEFSLVPLTVTAAATLKGIPLNRYRPYYAPFFYGDITSGTADLEATLNLHRGNPGKDDIYRIADGALRLTDLAICHPDGGELIALPNLALEGIVVDIPAREVSAASLTGSNGRLQVERDADGRINLLDLLPLVTPKTAADGKNAASSKASMAAEPQPTGTTAGARTAFWQIDFPRTALSGFAVTYTDHGPSTPAVIDITALDLGLTGLSTRPQTPANLEFSCRPAPNGTFTANGKVQISPPTVDLEVQLAGLPAKTAQPWISDQIDLLVMAGSATGKGHILVQPASGADGGGKPALHFTGNAAIENLKTVGGQLAEDVASWRRVTATGIEFSGLPPALKIAAIAVDEPRLRIAVLADGSTTIQALRVQPATDNGNTAKTLPDNSPNNSEAKPAAAKATTPPPATTAAETATSVIEIDRVRLTGGAISFTDLRLTPRYELLLTDLAGTAEGLSSMDTDPAALNLTGTLNNQAPVRISGSLNPLGKRFFADLDLVFTNIEMPWLTPYSGRFIGYTISKGKLNLDLHYRIDQRQLEARNRLFFDQLAFGDAVTSPEAMNLPVKLAVSLLQNRAGEIHLNLPVSGNLDDPEFSLGGIVFKMIVNLIAKAVTSPFALLGSIFGGGEDINRIAFAAGTAVPDDAGRENLAILAKALYDRPRLKVELAGGADRISDAEALHEARFRRLLQAQKLKRLVKKGETPPAVEEIVITPGEEFTELLWEAYKKAPFKKERNFIGLTKKIEPAAQEKMLRASVAVTADDLRQLARSRADTAAAFLTTAGPVEAARLFLVDPELGTTPDARRVEIRIR